MKTVRIILWFVVCFVFLLGLLYLFAGSLEAYPTSIQQENAYIASVLMLVFSALGGIILFCTRKKSNLIDEVNPDSESDYDYISDLTVWQNNRFNPGYYIGTGRMPPDVKAPGNTMPLAVMSFFATVLFTILGLYLFFSDANIISHGLIESPILNKAFALVIMLVISACFLVLGCAYLRKAKRYYKEKAALESEKTDDTVEDKIWQRTCPKCGKSHDIDYPKCPNCNYNYLE